MEQSVATSPPKEKIVESQLFDNFKYRLEELAITIKSAATVEEFQKIEEDIALQIQMSKRNFELFLDLAELAITRIQTQVATQKGTVSDIHYAQCVQQIETFSKKLEHKNLEKVANFKLTTINKYFMLQKHLEEVFLLWNSLVVIPYKALHPEYEPGALRARAIATTVPEEIHKMQGEITLLVKTRILPREHEWGIRGELNFNFQGQDVEALNEARKNGLESSIRSKEEKMKELETKLVEAQSADPRDPALEDKIRFDLGVCEQMLKRLKKFRQPAGIQA